jgi:hypothetical protein
LEKPVASNLQSFIAAYSAAPLVSARLQSMSYVQIAIPWTGPLKMSPRPNVERVNEAVNDAHDLMLELAKMVTGNLLNVKPHLVFLSIADDAAPQVEIDGQAVGLHKRALPAAIILALLQSEWFSIDAFAERYTGKASAAGKDDFYKPTADLKKILPQMDFDKNGCLRRLKGAVFKVSSAPALEDWLMRARRAE